MGSGQGTAPRPSPPGQPQVEYVPAGPAQPVAPDWTRTTPTLRPEGYSAVVGESYRQDALRRYLAAAGPCRLVVAQLVRDPHNPYHSGAVAVFVGSDLVGYIPRDALEGYAGTALYKALARLERQRMPATCWARLNGGTADKPSIGISLYTLSAEKPDEPYPFSLTVPPDRWAKLAGVDEHPDLFGRLIGAQQDEALVSCSLTAAGSVVMAAVDGTTVGSLSAAESAIRLPIVNALTEAGRPVIALARVRRSTGRREGKFLCSVSTATIGD
jgi:hypothetical protein